MPDAQTRVRVAVVGGGCAALTTAFELTKPEHEGLYDVTVYQMGWRLGGKGASGRGSSDRIEEHGLHLWLGFYENAFRLMRECYAALDVDEARRLTRWRDAFSPAPDVAVVDRVGDDAWDVWLAHFPAGRGLPGDPADPVGPMTVLGYMSRCAALVGELLRSAHAEQGESEPPASPDAPAYPTAEALAVAVDRVLRYGQLATFAALFEASDILARMIGGAMPGPARTHPGSPLRLIDALAAAARLQLERLVGRDDDLRKIWQVIDIILAILRGSTVHGLAVDPRGFDAINEYDWREWLRMHGASEQSVHSGFMNGIYDLVFAFEEGDIRRPRLAAGVALRGAVRMFFTYRGAFFWRMNAGMGDIVFAPLYEVLRARGVRFEFFHRLVDTKVGARPSSSLPHTPSLPHVASLDFNVQAEVDGGGEYEPLVDVHGVACWPSKPRFDQLVDGERLEAEGRAFESHWDERHVARKTLRVGEDFDFVVLGVSIGSLPHVAADLIAHEPCWREMVEHVKTVPTQAFQLWLRSDMSQLGWHHPPVNLSGFVQPFDTWADMGHLIAEESWGGEVRSIAYFCSVLPDPSSRGEPVTRALEERQRRVVRDNAVRFLDRDISTLWPGAVRSRGGFRWDLLACGTDRPERRGKDLFETQFWTANVNPSDRYVLSLPGSIKYRISPLDIHFDNLTIAGDWTASGLDSGCIESAVMSGLLAAHALSGRPALEDIVGYDHP